MIELNVKLFDGQITKNFNIKEMACNANQEVLLNRDTIKHADAMQELRDWYGKPLYVNSWYRTLAYNRIKKSPDTSYHVLGIATDIHIPAAIRSKTTYESFKKKWYEICEKYGVKGGVGFYDTFMHFDTRNTKTRGFWDDRKNLKWG